MLKVSHEVPISLLEQSKSFNDYDYCLLHLTSIPEYRSYYKKAIQEGREVLLDNSLFELGDSLTVEDVREGVLDINPTWVVVPDCLNNYMITVDRFKEWEDKCSDLNVLTIGVVQGSSLEEAVECYRFMSEHADKIAIPFDSVYFETLYPSESKLTSWCWGRQLFIQYLVDNQIWNNDKPHHLLGCSYAFEFSYSLYKKISIESIDTSNPVVAAIKNLKYSETGLDSKPSIKLCDLINEELTPEQLSLVRYNTSIFKKICGRNKWVAFFSQTGSEIVEISKKLGRYPDKIITNRQTLKGVVADLPTSLISFIPDKPTLQDYYDVLNDIDLESTLITLHGYLRIIPSELCIYDILNLHPGLITKYPELKGFNPQEKAFNLKIPTSGVVIHRVTSELDSGPIIASKELSIVDKPLDRVYTELHDIAVGLWVDVLRPLLQEKEF